jgi:hypothetical protein
MKYKNIPTWVKGGLVGLLVALIAILNFSLMGVIAQNVTESNAFWLIPLTKFNLIVALTLGLPIMITQFRICYKFCSPTQDFVITLVWSIIYILIGMVSGWIISKGKRKN